MTSRGARYWNTGAIPLIAPDLLGDIIAAASDLALVISPEAQILSVLTNPTHSYHGRLGDWNGSNLRDHLASESVDKLESVLSAFDKGEALSRPVELNHSDRAFWEFPVRYSFHRIGPDGALLMLGRDLRPIAEMQRQLVKAQLALEKDYETQRDYDTRFRVMMNVTREPLLFVTLPGGGVIDANRAAAKLLASTRSELLRGNFVDEFDPSRRGDLLDALVELAVAESGVPLVVETRREGRRVGILPSMFRASGERMLLCRLDSKGAEESIADELAENLHGLFQDGVDAIAFTNRDGVIQTANDSFLELADVAHLSAAKGRSLGDFLQRGSIDLKVLLETAARAGHMRLHATRMVSALGAQLPIEVSVSHLEDALHPAFAFVIRDASRSDAIRKPAGPATDESVRSVMELVGATTLKEIVAETTDVVEKMCIETAVEMTRNNRVAAAEMLGLSRQSLYVKLRKYGLLNKTPGS